MRHTFTHIICLNNLLSAWQEFVRGKRNKKDVQEFSFHLMDNIISLHYDLANGNYRHGGYHAFNISDPKPRNIHKASVRDRLVHHAIYRILYPFFDRTFIADSYSCRLGKGTHKAVNRFRRFAYKMSKNNTKTCWILKCDIRKFFASIDHQILKNILEEYIPDKKILDLLNEIIDSFTSIPLLSKEGVGEVMKAVSSSGLSKPPLTFQGSAKCSRGRICRRSLRSLLPVSASLRPPLKGGETGLPLGNLTSQLLVNIYMNEFDQFVKHRLKAKYYLRYADDFVILSDDKEWLESQVRPIGDFLSDSLKLTLHPDKIFIKTLNSGIDFLGWVNFFDHRVLRTKTKKRILRRILLNSKIETINSYLGLLKHGNTFKISKKVFEFFKISQF